MADIVFGIPLISQRVLRDWASVLRLLEATIGSALAQQEVSVEVIVVCHETPDISHRHDPRVSFVVAPFDIPRFRWEMEIDRMRKLEVIGTELRARGGGLLFILDSDDYVSRDLGRMLLASPTKATIVQSGYRLDARNNRYQNLDKLWGKCGSCVGIKWTVDELPIVPLADDPPIYHEFCETRHYALPEAFQKFGISFGFLSDPLVTYLVNHGSNQSEVIVVDNLKWRLYFLLGRWRPWTAALDARFGVERALRDQGVYVGNAKFSTEFEAGA